MKARQDHGRVLLMRADVIAVGREDDVAGAECVGATDAIQRVLDAMPHRSEEHRQSLGLGEQSHLVVIERGREVEHLVDDGREGRAAERDAHLVRGRVEPVPNDLRRDRIRVAVRRPATLRNRMDHGALARFHYCSSLSRRMKSAPVS